MDYLVPFPQDVLVSYDSLVPAPSEGSLLLGLYQSGALGNSPGIFELLTTFPPNWLPLTGWYDSQILEIAKHNTQALVFGGRGEVMTEDVIVSTGHRHDTVQSWLSWKQIANVLFQNFGASSVGSSPDECVDAMGITADATETDMSWQRLHLLPIEAKAITARIRVSHDAGTVNAVVTLYYYDTAMNFIKASVLPVTVDTAENRVWYYFDTVDLSMLPDDFSGKRPVLVRLTGFKDAGTEDIAIHELGFGVTTP